MKFKLSLVASDAGGHAALEETTVTIAPERMEGMSPTLDHGLAIVLLRLSEAGFILE